MESVGTLNGAPITVEKPEMEKPVDTPPVPIPAVVSKPEAPPAVPVVKPVNPLRLARPLEKQAQGLSKTSIPPTRPMPMPTISPLCPPGSAAAKNGIKGSAAPLPKNGTAPLEPPKPCVPVPVSQPVKATPLPPVPAKEEEKLPQEVPKPAPVVIPPPPPPAPLEKPPVEAPPKIEIIPVAPPKKAMSPAPPPTVTPPKEEEEEEVPAPTSLPENKPPPAKVTSPKKAVEGPKVGELSVLTPSSSRSSQIPVAEKSPRQKKRKASQEVTPLPDDEKRLSKRARAPPAIYESPDPEMAQILKTIKRQEEEDKRATSTSDKEEEQSKQKAKNKPKLLPKRKEKKKSIVEESDSDLDEPASPKPAPRSRVKRTEKPAPKPAPKPPAKKKGGDPVFFKDEYMAVRNAEGSFYICKAMQNIYMGSKNIKIQWLSNEDPVVPAKDNPDNDIYAHDFYDKTEFETILTSVDLEKTLGKSKRMILPEEELERINKILQRANDKAAGNLDMSDLLTEDNPDGLDISLYKGEDQLDEIDRKRKGDDKADKKSEKKVVKKKEAKPKIEKGKEEVNIKPEAKKRVARGEKVAAKEENASEPAKKEGGNDTSRSRRATKNVCYDQFDFLEDEDDEVMPVPKKRKSQDSMNAPEEEKTEAEIKPSTVVQTDKKEEEVIDKPEELSTSEKAALAEKAKMESEQKEKDEDSALATSETQQPAKKRGRKPKN